MRIVYDMLEFHMLGKGSARVTQYIYKKNQLLDSK